MSVRRTFSWILSTVDLKKIKKVVGVLKPGSAENDWLVNTKLPMLLQYYLISKEDYNQFLEQLNNAEIEVSFGMLKGRGPGPIGRKKALCTGIIQAVIEGLQKRTYLDNNGNIVTMNKPYTDDWTAEGYLRWAITCGLLEYNKDTDTCKITDLGSQLADSEDDSVEEKNAFTQALLLYPPVIRILSLLKEEDGQTKFELGSKLGFVGEMGFTSIPQNVYVCDCCEAASRFEKSAARCNDEGDSDKYAKGITSWLTQMGWVETSSKEVTDTYKGRSYTTVLQTYKITQEGEMALKKAKGDSGNPRTPRIVMFDMLASTKTPGTNYLRYQRACIIKLLSAAEKTLEQLQTELKSYDLEVSIDTIKDHILGLQAIGIDISENKDKYKLLDHIEKLEIPARSECEKVDLNDIKDRVRSRLKTIDHKYLVLIDLAYSDASPRIKKTGGEREFEMLTVDLLTKELDFEGMRLGDINRPDIIISYGTNGTIIDNKSYKDGFQIERRCADEMGRHINENRQRQPGVPSNEWWKEFNAGTTAYTFLYITSYLKGRFEEHLEFISKTHQGIKGAAIGVENFLYLAEKIKCGKMQYSDFYDSFNNKEIVITL